MITDRMYQSRREEDVGSVREMEQGARDAIGPWIAGAAEWDLYVTLTYDPRREDVQSTSGQRVAVAPSPSASRRHAERWLAETESAFGRSIGAAMAFERQKNGWPHWHGLIAAGGIGSSEFSASSSLWFRGRGFARFDRVDRQDPAAIAAYVGKYLTKEYGDLLLVGLAKGGGVAGQTLLPGVASRLESRLPGLVVSS